MGKGVGEYVVHTLTSAAALAERKCVFPPVFIANFCASTILGGSTETGLKAVAVRLLLPKVVWMLF